jgi:hypothetical protein
MAIIRAKNYDPAATVTKSCAALLPMTVIDSTNLRNAFVVPFGGDVMVRIRCAVHGAATFPQILLGVIDGQGNIIGRVTPMASLMGTPLATTRMVLDASFCVQGLSAGDPKAWDAAYGVELAVANSAIKYGGPNNTTGEDAFGGFVFEIWRA